jgi:hypothetical protein
MGSHRSAAAWVVSGVALVALAGCPTVDLGDTPADIGLCNPTEGESYFEMQVWPMYIDRGGGTSSCIRTGGGCHDQNGGNALSFATQPIDFKANFRAAQVYLNCGTPEMSELLTKPLQGIDDPHGGGNIFTTVNDPAVQIFLAWFK